MYISRVARQAAPRPAPPRIINEVRGISGDVD
jgi:hypothetical protein